MERRFKVPYSDPRWWWEGSIVPQCFECTYFQGNVEHKRRCTAFPDGIPNEIMRNEVQHTKPYPGDNGITFKQYQEPLPTKK